MMLCMETMQVINRFKTHENQALYQATLHFPKELKWNNHQHISLTESENYNSTLSKIIQFERDIRSLIHS